MAEVGRGEAGEGCEKGEMCVAEAEGASRLVAVEHQPRDALLGEQLSQLSLRRRRLAVRGGAVAAHRAAAADALEHRQVVARGDLRPSERARRRIKLLGIWRPAPPRRAGAAGRGRQAAI